MADLEFEDIQYALSRAPQLSPLMFSRRAFLQAVGAGTALSMIPSWLKESAAWAASPLGANDGVLVVIQMGGGNDGLNTVVPTGTPKYYDLRQNLAISPSAALPIAPGVGLHPSLSKLKSRYDRGKVAIVQGVAPMNPDLSHFNSMADWMSGWASGPTRTGWLGRYLDNLGTDPFYGVALGTSVPLHLQGSQTAAMVLPSNKYNLLLGGNVPDDAAQRALQAVRQYGSVSSGMGVLADAYALTVRTSVDSGAQVNALYTNPELPDGTLNSQLSVVSRLINANLGVRVFNVSFGSFDTHSAETGTHADLLSQLDGAVEQFFASLGSGFAGRVTLMTFSEFGRRPQLNSSGGTDHGTASPMFLMGDKVRGGLYGAQPSLTFLDGNYNLKPAVDFHSVYATVLTKWLNADSSQLLGGSFETHDLFTATPSGDPIATPTTGTPTIGGSLPPPIVPITRPISFPRAYRIVTAAGAVASYGGAGTYGNLTGESIAGLASTPDQRGYWLASKSGGIFTYGNAVFHGSAGNMRLNSPVVGLASTASGSGYWLLGRDGGIFSYGDAAFYGSTGAIRLNRPVVGMAATPQGTGYWLVASDGGIFAFGDARFYGSTGSMILNQPIVGMAATPDGAGYWLVASDGGIFAFGNARFYGSTGGTRLNQPIVGMASTPTGNGYRLVASDGGVFCFGDATFEGGLGAGGSGSPVIGIVT